LGGPRPTHLVGCVRLKTPGTNTKKEKAVIDSLGEGWLSSRGKDRRMTGEACLGNFQDRKNPKTGQRTKSKKGRGGRKRERVFAAGRGLTRLERDTLGRGKKFRKKLYARKGHPSRKRC